MNQTHAQKYQETFEKKYFTIIDEFEPTATIEKQAYIKYEVKFKDHSTITCVMTNIQRKEIEKLPLFKDILMLRGLGHVKIKEQKTIMRETQTTMDEMTLEDVILIRKNNLPVTLRSDVIDVREHCFEDAGFPIDKQAHFRLEQNIGKKLYISSYGERIGRHYIVRLSDLDLKDSTGNKVDSDRIPIPISALKPYLIPQEEVELDIMRTKTNNPHRFEENPIELLILKEWLYFNKDDKGESVYRAIAFNVEDRKNAFLNSEQEKLINSTIQWLGTPVGVGFMRNLFNKKEIEKLLSIIAF